MIASPAARAALRRALPTLLLLLALKASPAAAEPHLPTVAAIDFEGLTSTDPSVVHRELLIQEGAPLDPEALAESVQRLKNLRLFSAVTEVVEPLPDGRVRVLITVAEKWTLLPIARGGGGGGSTFFILGAYDINTAGRYLEVGGQYQNLNGSHSGVVWFRDPRFLGERLLLSVDVWSLAQIRRLYTPEGDLEGAWTLDRLKVNLGLQQELHRLLRIGVGGEFNGDSFSTNALNDDDRAANAANNTPLPAAANTGIARAWITLGQLNYEDYLVDGLQATTTVEHAPAYLGSDLGFTRLTHETLAFKLLPFYKINLAARLSLGHINTDAQQYLFFIGGLDYKRGFLDGQFRGQDFWELNAEVRVPSLETSWVVLQHNVFFDIGDVADDPADLATLYRVPCMSGGVGLRVISPRIFRLVLRLDYAIAHAATTSQGISFGVQQFF